MGWIGMFDPVYWMIVGPTMLLAFWAQMRVKSALSRIAHLDAPFESHELFGGIPDDHPLREMLLVQSTLAARGIEAFAVSRRVKLSMASRMISFAVSIALSSWNSMCVAPGNLAFGLIETTLVWKHFPSPVIAGKMHWTSRSPITPS